ncbi:hypothetical protein KTD19_12490 [Burkholderia multivorans]|uniref:hypothetical protein n=1 Tax=Burkholderia multivorans TaxID=87883 RepID=UPI0012DF7796|nr:hypothetical protein [Burkholderia multivorans]MBU9233211.1 hypothetical protein [Burkholderia multivorans]QGR95077.1 hypothetical protein FOC30_30135 [Burkholderia multivorans]HEF4739714.1 hypothetical protein [Burkholderia multivorans]
MDTDFQAQRAVLKAELTAIALAGGDTAKVRDKLAKLDAREQSAREAEAAAQAAERNRRLIEAAERGAQLGAEAVARLVSEGFAVSEFDAQQFDTLGRTVAHLEAELGLLSDARAAALEQVQRVETRITALEERSQALTGLRLTGQAVERDLNELVAIEKDVATLREALAAAQAKANAVQIPDDMLRQRQRAVEGIAEYERSIAVRSLRDQVALAEAELLASIRKLVAVSGAAHPSHVYTRSVELDRFLRLGIL